LFLAYRDENGKPWVLPSVLDVENRLLKSDTYNREYVIFLGLDAFNELVPRLILGEDSPALKSGRVSNTQ
jgi:aspartate aminotransferase